MLSTKNLVATAIGIALYAALTIPFNVFTIPGVYDVAIRPTVAIPIVFGFIFGPVAGFFSGFIGNILSDQLSFGAFFWNWDLGNGLIGLIPAIGYYVIKRSDWAKTRGLAATAILAIVASVIGIGFSALTDLIFQIGLTTVGAAVAEFIPAAVTDAINGAIIAPILLYTYVRSTAGRARRL
ncbi:MAG: ECF transporter S component [Nitrososphaerota archaeon]|nr:ECF transporter S component [Nitrososphaerota archaeon]MDG6956132.1 ECF transporter S component [Nitrososphaerota archaeon]MDG6958925.1 ECF transporter S component [Nitrososphaerota archaeon]MDG6960135.1 ECF transporter S component [Nitrososphaerota archaeon]